jgi:hypothetical protein
MPLKALVPLYPSETGSTVVNWLFLVNSHFLDSREHRRAALVGENDFIWLTANG